MKTDNKHLNRKSYFERSESIWDNYKNLGFDYKGNLFKKSVSSLFYTDERKIGILNEFEKMMYELVEQVKTIKKFRNFAIKKDSHNIN